MSKQSNASSRKMNKVFIIQVAIGAILIVLFLLLFLGLKDDFLGYKPNEETVQYVFGQRLEHSANAEFMINDGIVTIKDNDVENSVLNQPILFEKDINDGNKLSKLTIVTDMMYSNPSVGGAAYRLPYFTNLEYFNGHTKIKYDGKENLVSGGFLFDGGDLYIFLDSATLHIGNKVIELAPLSYVRVTYRETMEYYNSKDGKYDYMGQNKLSIIVDLDDDYSIDLSTDVLYSPDGEMLIYTAVENLDVISLK